MTQPPGGYPPPPHDPSSGQVPGGYPPPAQPGAPGQPSGPAPQYGPPGGYPPQAPPPAPGQPAGPPPGHGQQQPGYGQQPPAYGQQPPAGYPPQGQPPAPGYGQPPAGPAGYGPPPGYGPPAQHPGQAQAGPYPGAVPPGQQQFDLSKIDTLSWIIWGLGFVLLIFSFFGWVSTGFASAGGWNTWWFLIPILVVAVTVLQALITLGVMKPVPVKPLFLFYGALAAVVLYIGALIHIFASYTVNVASAAADGCSEAGLTGEALSLCEATARSYASDLGGSGPGFGIWASIVLAIGFAYFVGLWAQKVDKLPFAIPGPKL